MTYTLQGLLLSLSLFALTGCAASLIAGGTVVGISTALDPRTTGTIVEDQGIKLRTAEALRKDPRLQGGSHINVTSYNKIVLLSGEVPSPELQLHAGDIAARITDVKQVHNELAVAPPSSFGERSNDVWIATKVKSSLPEVNYQLPEFDPIDIKVVTERGVVYLFGLVRPEEGDAVTEVARRVNGVKKIVKLFEYI